MNTVFEFGPIHGGAVHRVERLEHLFTSLSHAKWAQKHTKRERERKRQRKRGLK